MAGWNIREFEWKFESEIVEIVDLPMKNGDVPSFFCMFTRPGNMD